MELSVYIINGMLVVPESIHIHIDSGTTWNIYNFIYIKLELISGERESVNLH